MKRNKQCDDLVGKKLGLVGMMDFWMVAGSGVLLLLYFWRGLTLHGQPKYWCISLHKFQEGASMLTNFGEGALGFW